MALEPIGIIHSPFVEKFGVPRQAGLAPSARAELALFYPWNQAEAVRGLEGFSHIWLIYRFHASPAKAARATVRPPRLGGNQRIGVFASRSNFRPNPLGLSAVRLQRIEKRESGVVLHLQGADLLDQTPVLDIKPYLPYSDAIQEASGGFAAVPPAKLPVRFTPQAQAACQAAEASGFVDFQALLVELLQTDPRPAYYGDQASKTRFAMRLGSYEIRWEFEPQGIGVVSVERKTE